jgi:hypothetical protein
LEPGHDLGLDEAYPTFTQNDLGREGAGSAAFVDRGTAETGQLATVVKGDYDAVVIVRSWHFSITLVVGDSKVAPIRGAQKPNNVLNKFLV